MDFFYISFDLFIFFSLKLINFQIHPFEDAAMIMRYAEHLANGHGITWNIGQSPVDGATDFLFMIILAASHYLGLSLELASSILPLIAHVLTVAIVYWSIVKLYQQPPLIAFITGLFWQLVLGYDT